MQGDKRKNAGRKPLWDKTYRTSIMRLPLSLRFELITARKNKVPVKKIAEAIKAVA